jgi:hypothetical protein
LGKVVLRVAVDPKDKNLKRRGVLIEVNRSVEDQHKVFNWTDAESTSSIWLTQSLGQSETDAKSRSDRRKV